MENPTATPVSARGNDSADSRPSTAAAASKNGSPSSPSAEKPLTLATSAGATSLRQTTPLSARSAPATTGVHPNAAAAFRVASTQNTAPFSAAETEKAAAPPLWSPTAGTLLSFNRTSLAFVVTSPAARGEPTTHYAADPQLSPRRQPHFQFPLGSPHAERKPHIKRLNRHFQYRRRQRAKSATSSTAKRGDASVADVPTKEKHVTEERLQSAHHRRITHLNRRRAKIQRRHHEIRQRVLLQRQKDKLNTLRFKMRTDYAMRAAQLKRQIILQQHVARYAALVDHAHSVALLQRMKKVVDLRRSYSTTFAEILASVPELDTRALFGDDPGSPVHRRTTASPGGQQRPPNPNNANHAGMMALGEKFETFQVTSATPSPRSPAKSPLPRSQSITFPIQTEDRQILTTHLTDLSAVFGDNLPPITKLTLRELSLDSILGSVQLRHDMIFDPTLEFRVNDSGERAVQKKTKLDRFWADIEADVDGTRYGQPRFHRIPVLINEIKEILLELASEDYKKSIEQGIDVPLLAQQLQHGVMNLGQLVGFVSATMKAHCAPARDKMIDDMVALAQESKLTLALRQAFNILEHMKLDVANDLLRRLRPMIIENAPQFEWSVFRDRLQRGDANLVVTTKWLSEARKTFLKQETASISATTTGTPTATPSRPTTDLFYDAFFQLILYVGEGRIDYGEPIPETFSMDLSRLQGFFNDWQDTTISACLLTLFRQFAAQTQPSSEKLLELKNKLWVLLVEEDTSMDHISLFLSSECGKLRKKEFTQQETAMVVSIVDKTLTPDNKIYQLLRQRIQTQLLECVKGKQPVQLDKQVLAQQGLLEVEVDIRTLGEKMRALVDHNKNVYASIYNQILALLAKEEER